METTPFTDKPMLRGELVTLRPIRAEDADAIDAIIRSDDEVAQLTGSVHSSTEKPAGMPIERLREIYGAWAVADDRLVLAVIDNTSGDLVGDVVLNDWDEGNESCGFRTLIGAAGRGRGLGTEATRLIVEHGLTVTRMHRITLEVSDFNPRSRHPQAGIFRRGIMARGVGRRRPGKGPEMGIEDRLGYIAARQVHIESQDGRDFEVQTIKLPHTASRNQVRRLLTEEAEHGHWELQRLRRYRDGSTQAWLRRRVIKVRSTLGMV